MSYAGHKAVGVEGMSALGGDTVLVALNIIHTDRAFFVFAVVAHFLVVIGVQDKLIC